MKKLFFQWFPKNDFFSVSFYIFTIIILIKKKKAKTREVKKRKNFISKSFLTFRENFCGQQELSEFLNESLYFSNFSFSFSFLGELLTQVSE